METNRKNKANKCRNNGIKMNKKEQKKIIKNKERLEKINLTKKVQNEEKS